jgi:hypothetical protein
MKYDGDSTLFQTGGKMATRMAAKGWAETPLGSPSSWPQSLRAIVRVMLTSRYAMWMAWGPDLTFFCNDAYLPTLGVKESWALGTTARKVWEEIWPDIGPRIDHVLATGEATWDQALLLFLERSGFPEETYHTFSYSPLWDDDGQISGMLCVVTEETERVIGERRLATLRDFAAELSRSSSEEEVFTAAGRCLANAQHDFPFHHCLPLLCQWYGLPLNGLFGNNGRLGAGSANHRLRLSRGSLADHQVVRPRRIHSGGGVDNSLRGGAERPLA